MSDGIRHRDARPEFVVAWDEINRRLKDVTMVNGLDDAAVEGVLLRLAAHLHLRNGGDLISFAETAGVNFDRAERDRENTKEVKPCSNNPPPFCCSSSPASSLES